jgi:hypothetical protein
MCARIQLPLDILRYILSFFEEWRIVGDKFVHIAKLSRIPRLDNNDEFYVIKLPILDKFYLICFHVRLELFIVALKQSNQYLFFRQYYRSENRIDWEYRSALIRN